MLTYKTYNIKHEKTKKINEIKFSNNIMMDDEIGKRIIKKIPKKNWSQPMLIFKNYHSVHEIGINYKKQT